MVAQTLLSAIHQSIPDIALDPQKARLFVTILLTVENKKTAKPPKKSAINLFNDLPLVDFKNSLGQNLNILLIVSN